MLHHPAAAAQIAYTYLPDPRVPLTARGWQQVGGQAVLAGLLVSAALALQRLAAGGPQVGGQLVLAGVPSGRGANGARACRLPPSCLPTSSPHFPPQSHNVPSLPSLPCCQAMSAGDRLKACMDEASGEEPSKLFFYTSPYLRSRQVCALCVGGHAVAALVAWHVSFLGGHTVGCSLCAAVEPCWAAAGWLGGPSAFVAPWAVLCLH